MHGDWLPTVLLGILLVLAVLAWIFSVAWVYDDANRRNMAGWAVALLVAFVFVAGQPDCVAGDPAEKQTLATNFLVGSREYYW